MHLRLIRLGLLNTQDLQALFEVCDETIHNAVKRGDLPPPVKLFGRHYWSWASIQEHIDQRLLAAREQAERERVQKETKLQALHGGHPHGRR
jgi:hypothetical protein